MKINSCSLSASGRRPSHCGFTLIELLVVIAIIAIPVSYTHLTLPTICSV